MWMNESMKYPHSYCYTSCAVLVEQVEYQCEGFLEKNKDTVNEEQINVMKASKVRSTDTHLHHRTYSRSKAENFWACRHITVVLKVLWSIQEIKTKKPAAGGEMWYLVCLLTARRTWRLRKAAPSTGHVNKCYIQEIYKVQLLLFHYILSFQACQNIYLMT